MSVQKPAKIIISESLKYVEGWRDVHRQHADGLLTAEELLNMTKGCMNSLCDMFEAIVNASIGALSTAALHEGVLLGRHTLLPPVLCLGTQLSKRCEADQCCHAPFDTDLLISVGWRCLGAVDRCQSRGQLTSQGLPCGTRAPAQAVLA